jgi:hypothetical protein
MKRVFLGVDLVPQSTKVLLAAAWLCRHEPRTYPAGRRMCLPHDYLNLWLTGTRERARHLRQLALSKHI